MPNAHVFVRPALCDCGLTKVLDGVNATSTKMKGAGSTRWMSPELLNDSSRSRESDVHALGMTLAEVGRPILSPSELGYASIWDVHLHRFLTGKVPFPDLINPGSVIFAIVTGQSPPAEPSSRDGRPFGDIWALASSCWHSDPAQRPSAADTID